MTVPVRSVTRRTKDLGLCSRYWKLRPTLSGPTVMRSDPKGLPATKMTRQIHRGTGLLLLADDEALVRDVACRMLRRLGYEVEPVADGVEAVARVMSGPTRFNLALLDGNMPRMTGREAAILIREVSPGLPLVLATGFLDPSEAEHLDRYGFNASIAKPYNLSELSRVVAEQLGALEKKGE